MINTNIKNMFIKKKLIKIFDLVISDVKNFQMEVNVSVNYVSSDSIKSLNKEYRNIDKVTDVLSFPMLSIKAGEKLDDYLGDCYIENGKKILELGDIVICKQKARMQAKEYGHSYTREVLFLAVHGLLHLLGYDHIEKKDEKIMNQKLEKILSENGVKR